MAGTNIVAAFYVEVIQLEDRNVQYPMRYRDKLTGQIFDLEPMPGTVINEGTPLNKANLLSDETATIYGLSLGDANVDKALQAAMVKITDKTYNIITITSSQSFAIPNTCSAIDLLIIGGGAGGKGGGSWNYEGGGAGGMISVFSMNVKVGQGLNITIGAGGRGGAYNSIGEAGGDTMVEINGLKIKANGGDPKGAPASGDSSVPCLIHSAKAGNLITGSLGSVWVYSTKSGDYGINPPQNATLYGGGGDGSGEGSGIRGGAGKHGVVYIGFYVK